MIEGRQDVPVLAGAELQQHGWPLDVETQR